MSQGGHPRKNWTAPFIATLGDGIYAFDLNNRTYRHLSISEGLPSSKINHAIRTPSGGVWLATDKGLAYVDDAKSLTDVSIYGESQGLNDGHILALQHDNDGNIWISTFSGLSCFVTSTERFHNYNHYDTRLLGGFANGAVTMDADGTICFGSAGGVCYFNP